ncbi:EEF1A lysine methyltransferase 2 [Scaptodrosophila lebanonensis]|uniref:Protein-lysine N-methyltransferase LOC115633119 n=1 Tax=Drosophila lebanonensis TaxID=7225 RepID=A0A6J2UG44_DROLE|nr:EEF1A lysine methyltransferase 2 [Scaptodrosophila lebanonensis]
MSVDELDGSELGTIEYWESSYRREVENYKNHGDVGEIWFDEDSQLRIIGWIMKQVGIAECAPRVLDVGCGNGMFLIELAREGFSYSQLVGVDYSPKAIELASNIAKDQSLDITYSVVDLMDAEKCKFLGSFHIVHDKGTYDAISLCPNDPKEKRAQYLSTVEQLLCDKDSLFIITSCNWTEDELLLSFADKFVKFCTIPTPTFKFGGKVGSVVTSIVFKKRLRFEEINTC